MGENHVMMTSTTSESSGSERWSGPHGASSLEEQRRLSEPVPNPLVLPRQMKSRVNVLIQICPDGSMVSVLSLNSDVNKDL